MKKERLSLGKGQGSVATTRLHTIVLGSGAAGLNAAVELWKRGVKDIAILTEGLKMGTSINTGSDKQTYYKLAMCGSEADSPKSMAESYFAGGSMHGDLALVEATLSAQAFLNLVGLGVPFPHDEYGQIVGYKTDHDPRQRATSIGPYTSREMCRALIREVRALGIPLLEKRYAVELLTTGKGRKKRAAGIVAVDSKCKPEVYLADNVVFAVGGPGGLYKTSVYPNVHTGAIGLALKAGAKAQSLPESQYGMASTKFRWNVSGTYMQVVPRFISTDAKGKDEQEFLLPYFKNAGEMNSQVFLKGYQWPFDSRKSIGGSSIVDILVYIETVLKGRRVYMDFTRNASGYKLSGLSEEARDYLKKSGAKQKLPIGRLRHMNPGAIQLYANNRIDISKDPLEIAVCAQHNNGGLASNAWWESPNLKHLFPVGEVNGSHGVYRPGGSALNAGQVGSMRAAEYIANKYSEDTLSDKDARRTAVKSVKEIGKWMKKSAKAKVGWREIREELQERMSEAGAHIRSSTVIEEAVDEAWAQYVVLEKQACLGDDNARGMIEALRNRQLCYAHAVYLESIRFAIESGVGSRGSAVVLDRKGKRIHSKLSGDWKIQLERSSFRDKVQETSVSDTGRIKHAWVKRRAMPDSDLWFETVWARFRKGEIYR